MAGQEITGTFKVGDQEFTIAELAGINLAEVRAVRQVRLPPGLYKLAIADTEFQPVELGDEKIKSVAISVALEVKEVHMAFEWPSKKKIEDADVLGALIEKKHFERFMNKNSLLDMIGAYKAFLVDVGFTTDDKAEELQAIMNQSVGYEFMGMIKWSKNPNDADMPYINLNRMKIAAIGAKELVAN